MHHSESQEDEPPRTVSHLNSQQDSHIASILHSLSLSQPPSSEHPLSSSVELKALKACTTQLETALKRQERDLLHFLNLEGFISDEVHDDVLNPLSIFNEVQKAGKLVRGIKWRVKQDRGSYHKLVAKLKEFGKVYEPLLRALEAEHSRQIGSQGAYVTFDIHCTLYKCAKLLGTLMKSLSL